MVGATTTAQAIENLKKINAIMPSAKDLFEPKGMGSRFTVKEFIVNGRVPCPLCGEWPSAANNARHYKTSHNTTPKEILTQTEYRAKALEMAANERARTGEK